MTETASFRSRFREFAALYRWSVRKNLGLLFLLTLLLFMALPMLLLITAPGWMDDWKGAADMTAAQITEQINMSFSRFLGSLGILALVLLMVFTVVLTIVLFGYFQKKRSVDFFHALPVGRIPLLLSGWCAGLTVLYIPLVANMLALQAIAASYGFQTTGGTLTVLPMMAWMMLMIAAVYTFCVLMMACSGSVFDTAVSVLGISIGYPLLIICGSTVAQMFLPGFVWDIQKHVAVVTALSPFAAAYAALSIDHGTGMLVWWIVLTALMLFGACFVYRWRKSEAAEDRFAFPAVKIVIRFLATAVAGIGLGLVLMNANGGGFFIGLLSGSIAAHVIVEVVYSRGFRHVKQSVPWYVGFAVLALIYYGVLSTGFFGYDQRVPNAADVQSVQVDMTTEYSGEGCNEIYDENNREIAKLTPVVTNPENIRTVTEAHKKVAAMIRSSGYPYLLSQFYGEHLHLTYTLKNGKTLTRTFQCFSPNMDFNAFHASERDIAQMEEYYRQLDMIFYIQPENIETINYSDSNTRKASESEVSLSESKAILEALREDYSKGKVNQPENVRVLESTRARRSLASDSPILNIQLNYKQHIVPKDSRLIALLGNYKGTINLNSYGGYDIYSKDTATYRLFQKLNLEK